MSLGGASYPPVFWSLKKGTRTVDFRSNEPSPDLLGLLVRYNHPWEKRIKKKKSTRICDLFLIKVAKFHIFCT